MALKLTPLQLNELLASYNSATPYEKSDPALNELDGQVDFKRLNATKARDILKKYFSEHPEENTIGFCTE